MARKKIVFVIVEGPSDETALGALLSHIFDSNSVFVHIMHRDITTDKGINSQNILAHLGNEVRGYAKSNHFKNSDFQEIIHIVDMDGAYIPENCIIEDTSLTNPVYSTETITAPSAARIIARNRQKSRNLDKLCSSSRLCNIPYRIFYMSCNLDHVLYNKLNCTDVEKENDAYSFALQYRQNTAAFKALICNSDFSVLTGQKESWEFIKSGTESLKRHTNLGLCFPNGTDAETLSGAAVGFGKKVD